MYIIRYRGKNNKVIWKLSNYLRYFPKKIIFLKNLGGAQARSSSGSTTGWWVWWPLLAPIGLMVCVCVCVALLMDWWFVFVCVWWCIWIGWSVYHGCVSVCVCVCVCGSVCWTGARGWERKRGKGREKEK